MLDIPAGPSARRSWSELPEQTRVEVRRLAAEGKPHPELEIAAIAVGWVRHGVVQERRAELIGVGVGAVAGGLTYASGGSGYTGMGVFALVFVALRFGLVPWRGRLPGYAELPNLLALVEAAEPEPTIKTVVIGRRDRPYWIWPALLAAMLAGAIKAESLSDGGGLRWLGHDGLIFFGVIAAVLVALRLMSRDRLPISIGPQGLELSGPSRQLAWHELESVELLGPTRDKPLSSWAVRWSIVGAPPVTVYAKQMNVPPEAAVLATLASKPA